MGPRKTSKSRSLTKVPSSSCLLGGPWASAKAEPRRSRIHGRRTGNLSLAIKSRSQFRVRFWSQILEPRFWSVNTNPIDFAKWRPGFWDRNPDDNPGLANSGWLETRRTQRQPHAVSQTLAREGTLVRERLFDGFAVPFLGPRGVLPLQNWALPTHPTATRPAQDQLD